MDEIPEEIQENVYELVEHTKMASYQVFIIWKKIFILIGDITFGVAHKGLTLIFGFLLKLGLELFKRTILVLIFVYLYMLSLCSNKRGQNPFKNKSKGEVLSKLDKIWETKKITLALDLDHTLVNTSKEVVATSDNASVLST